MQEGESLNDLSLVVDLDDLVDAEVLRQVAAHLAVGVGLLVDECVGEPVAVVELAVDVVLGVVARANLGAGEQLACLSRPLGEEVGPVESVEEVLVTLKAEVEGTLGHTEEVEGVPVVQGHLHDLEVGHLEVEDRVELVIVHPLDLGSSI